jgi:hypothetical protein
MNKLQRTIVEAVDKGYTVAKCGEVISPAGKTLKLCPNRNGYLGFSIRDANLERQTVPVHKVVSYLKFGKDSFKPGIHTRHLNGNHLDNSWDNIAIGTASENQMDKSPDTRLKAARVAAAKRRSLTEEEVEELRSLQKQGWTNKQLRERYGIAKSTVSYIVNGKTYNYEQ